MAYLAMHQIDAPREVAEIVVDGSAVKTRGATAGNAAARDGGIEFDLTLPFLAFYVPKEARQALALVPLLFKVTQGGGDSGLAIDASVFGQGKVAQIEAQ